MPFSSLLRIWLQQAAAQRLREAVAQAAAEQAGLGAQDDSDQDDGCDVGLVFATEVESGGLEDLLQGAVFLRGNGFTGRRGRVHGSRLVILRCGAGRQHAIDATEALILGHHPPCIISAGFAGGLQKDVARHDLVVADSLSDAEGHTLPITPPLDPASLPQGRPIHVGRIVTIDHIAHSPEEKAELGQKHQALCCDMESYAVAEVCRDRGIPFLAVRIISDALADQLPRHLESLARQKTSAGRWGAALGALVNRPSSIKDLWSLKENALVATDRLAKFLSAMVGKE
jgi:adenosylhomocysteine nucleosidase